MVCELISMYQLGDLSEDILLGRHGKQPSWRCRNRQARSTWHCPVCHQFHDYSMENLLCCQLPEKRNVIFSNTTIHTEELLLLSQTLLLYRAMKWL